MVSAVILLPNQSIGKPFQPPRPPQRERIFTTAEPQLSHIANETSGVRRKRQVPITLQTVCPGSYSTTQSSSSSQPCVKEWFYCSKYNLMEAVCKWRGSFACLSSIRTSPDGFPGCNPVYSRKPVKITLDNGRRIVLKLITDCTCAW